MAVHQCPDCELRFATEPELRDHLDSEHPGRVSPRRPDAGGQAEPPESST